MKSARAVLLIFLVLAAGCSSDSSTTTPSTTTPASPVTETVTTVVTQFGLTSHTFISPAGTATAILTSSTPGGIVLGFGMGIPQPNGGSCLISVALTTPASPSAQISVPVDAGRYCFAVYDVGNLTTQPVSFTVSLTHL